VTISSGSAAVSASATAASGFPASGGGGSSDYPQQEAFPLAATNTPPMVSSFMNKSDCACIGVSACTVLKYSIFSQACCAPKLPAQIQQDSHDVCRRTSTNQYVPVYISMYWNMYSHMPSCTAMYHDRLSFPMTSTYWYVLVRTF
jgi:hypothetical protein